MKFHIWLEHLYLKERELWKYGMHITKMDH